MTVETMPAVRNSGLVERQDYAKALAVSNLLPRQYQNNPGNVLYAIEFGQSIGVSTMAAILGVHIIEGRACASAGLISGLVRDAGHRLRVWVERDDNGKATKAVATIMRKDDPDFEFRSEWTLARAQAAKLTGKAVWQNYPEAMLKARATTEVAREACEEALRGIGYTPEELGAEVNEDGSVVITEARQSQGRSLGEALGVTAEQVSTDEPRLSAADADPEGATITQRNAIGAAMVAQGHTRESAPVYLSEVVGRPVKGTHELTGAEATQVMHALDQDERARADRSGQRLAQSSTNEDIQDADLVEEAESAEPIVMISKAQLSEMHALLRECGVTNVTGKGSTAVNDERRFAFLSDFLKRPITSSSQLAHDEAGAVIAALRELRVEMEVERNARLTRVGSLFDELGVVAVDDRLRDTSTVLRRTVTTPDTLTDADIALLLERLEATNGEIDLWSAILDASTADQQ
ncbi:recombinase RecT [Streptosporangium saharense]|uniref:RecT family protein n=1 Tax=Streptosporangium saharense TaxID=1706840 RepID=A0A7W7QK35_9ACTN|nr:recombinase RecT [Streptosporangium saharense]MBB4915065.1 hypothetical protein [Streptosporangium saharense]